MFRFTIRDVLWLTVLAAVFVAWWLDRNAVRAKAEKTPWNDWAQNLEKILEYEGYSVTYPANGIEVKKNGRSYSFSPGIHGIRMR